ncbi:MAG: thrombospondin type 3 repeat-containing protein [Pontiella sp.]
MRFGVVAVLVGAFLMGSITADAALVTYTGPADSDLTDGANWSTAAYPAIGDYCQLNTTSVITSAVPNNLLALEVGNGADGVLNIQTGAVYLANMNVNWNSQIGLNAGNGTVNQSGGFATFNELELGRTAGAVGNYNLSGGHLIISGALGGASLHLGSSKTVQDFGTGIFTISGGGFTAPSAVKLGDASLTGTGTFSVQGAGSTNISLGGWNQHVGSILELGVAVEGITPITISGNAYFSFGSTVDVSFIEGELDPGYWTVMTVAGTISDEGMLLADDVDATMWNFGVTNGNELWVSYGMGGWVAPTVPPPTSGVYAWPTSPSTVSLAWAINPAATGYHVKRSTESGTNYVTIATGVTELNYADTTVSSNMTYYYVVSGANDSGEGADSEAYRAVVIPYTIIGTDTVWDSTDPTLYKYSLFDGDIDTFFDGSGATAWAGLDFGANNAQQIVGVRYVLRNDSNAWKGNINAQIQGANSADFSDAVTLYTLGSNSVIYSTMNSVEITDENTYRYVRLTAGNRNAVNFMAEINFVLTTDFTTSGTSKFWLDEYGLVTGGDYEAADYEDTDGDGLLNWEEYYAGTDPTDASSVLAFNSMTVDGADVVLIWQSVEGKSYSILTHTSLTFPNVGTVASGIVATSNETSYTISSGSGDAVFYEVGVE